MPSRLPRQPRASAAYQQWLGVELPALYHALEATLNREPLLGEIAHVVWRRLHDGLSQDDTLAEIRGTPRATP